MNVFIFESCLGFFLFTKDIYSKLAELLCDKFDKSITQNSFFKYNNLFCFGQEFNRA